MKRLLPVLMMLPLLLLVGCQTITTERSADIQKGLDAYNKGDYATALREFKPQAKLRNPYAQLYLGVMYSYGKGVPRNYETGVKWFKLAADQGNVMAQYILGLMYGRGDGVPRNYETAVKWNTLAADQGLADAQNELGAMYFKGKGVPRYPQGYLSKSVWCADSNPSIDL